jgi:hypothetical protein
MEKLNLTFVRGILFIKDRDQNRIGRMDAKRGHHLGGRGSSS